LDDRDAPADHPDDRGGPGDHEATRIRGPGKPRVVALPRLSLDAVLADPCVRLGGVRLVRLTPRGAGERPDLELAHVLVRELLVQSDRAAVLHDHLEPDPFDAVRARVLVEGLHQPAPGAAPPLRRDDADDADPGLAAAEPEVRVADALAVPDGDHRRGAFEVARLGE